MTKHTWQRDILSLSGLNLCWQLLSFLSFLIFLQDHCLCVYECWYSGYHKMVHHWKHKQVGVEKPEWKPGLGSQWMVAFAPIKFNVEKATNKRVQKKLNTIGGKKSSFLHLRYDIKRLCVHDFKLRSTRQSLSSATSCWQADEPSCVGDQNFYLLNRAMNLPHSSLSKLFILHRAVSASWWGKRSALYLRPLKTNSIGMTSFDPKSYKTLEEIVHHLKSSSCCLDILPTGFFPKMFFTASYEVFCK